MLHSKKKKKEAGLLPHNGHKSFRKPKDYERHINYTELMRI